MTPKKPDEPLERIQGINSLTVTARLHFRKYCCRSYLEHGRLLAEKPSRTSLYLEGRMLDLRTDTGHWSTLNQWGAPLPRAGRRTESVPRGQAVSPGLSAGKDVIAER